MSKKIYVSPSNQVANLYATGNTNEREQCHKIAKACVEFLNDHGFAVMCTYNDDMYARVRESNEFGADIHLAIHTNATGAHNITGGTQILLYSLSGERKKAGEAVLNRLAPLTPGNSAERLVEKPGFYEVKKANGITVYCECEFHDTVEGSDFIINNTTAIGEEIAKGICDYYGVAIKAPAVEAKPEPGTLYRVQVGAFSSPDNANQQAAKIKAAGFEAIIVNADKFYKVQVGAYSIKENAEATVANLKAKGFDAFITTKSGTVVSEPTPAPAGIKVGDKVKMQKDAPQYGKKTKFQSWVYNSTLYAREISGNRVVVSTQRSGDITGAVDKKYLTKI